MLKTIRNIALLFFCCAGIPNLTTFGQGGTTDYNAHPQCTTICVLFATDARGNPVKVSCQSKLGIPGPASGVCPTNLCASDGVNCFGGPVSVNDYNLPKWSQQANGLVCHNSSHISVTASSDWFCVKSVPCECVFVGEAPRCAKVISKAVVTSKITEWVSFPVPTCITIGSPPG